MPECQCYPSMDILTVATEEYLSSALDNNLDIAELGLFLAVVKDRQQLTTLALGECVTPSSTIQQGNLGHNLGDPVKRDHSVKVLWPFQISNQGVGQAALLRGPEASDHHGVSHLYLWWPAPERGNCLVDCSCCGGQERFRPRSSGWPPWSWRGPPSTSSISTLITITWSHLSYPGMQGLLWLQRWRLTRLFQLTRAWSSSTSSCPTPSSWNRTQQSQRRSRESVLSRWESLQHPRVSFSDLR